MHVTESRSFDGRIFEAFPLAVVLVFSVRKMKLVPQFLDITICAGAVNEFGCAGAGRRMCTVALTLLKIVLATIAKHQLLIG